MTSVEYQWTKKNTGPTLDLIKELNILINNLEHGWKCEKYKVTKTNKRTSNNIERLDFAIEFTLKPTTGRVKKWQMYIVNSFFFEHELDFNNDLKHEIELELGGEFEYE